MIETPPTAVEVRSLEKRYDQHTILAGISLAVARGEVCAIVGPSGGGKTTFLRCLNGLEDFQGGEVDVAGETLRPGTPRASVRPNYCAYAAASAWSSSSSTCFPIARRWAT